MQYKLLKEFFPSEYTRAAEALALTHDGEFEEGRQKTGYRKLNIKRFLDTEPWLVPAMASCFTALEKDPNNDFWDAWILDFPSGSFIPPHRDAAALFGKRHKRMNVIVENPLAGGDFQIEEDRIKLYKGDGILFYPDEVTHQVGKVIGNRLVFSVGLWE